MKLTLVQNTHDPSNLLSEVGVKIPPSGIRRFFDIVYSTPDCISLGVGEPDFDTPWRISDTGIYAIRDGCTHYTPNRGLPELRETLADYLESMYNVNYNPDTEMIITMGVSQGLDLALRSLINPGDEVIIVEPCYVSYSANVELLYGVPVSVPTYQKDNFQIDLDLLKKSITKKTKAILLNYPSNPTGSVLEKGLLEDIAKLALQHNFFILSDELYSAITYGHEHFSICSIPEVKDRCIHLNGFSKSHAMTGWRLGFVCGPQFVIDNMLKIHQYTALCAPSIAQYAAVEALKNGEKEVKRMNAEYQRRRNFIVSRFNEVGLPCLQPGGAFYVFPDITPSGLSSEDFALKLLEEEKVAVVPGGAFGACGEGHIRCSYATSMDNIRESMIRIEHFMSSRIKR